MSMPGIEIVLYTGAIGLVAIGLAGLLMVNNAFRLILALVLFEAGANLLLILSGFRETGVAPIVVNNITGISSDTAVQVMNDPVPQALVLTAIVIGVGIQALALALVLKLRFHYGTLDMRQIREQLEHGIAINAGVATPTSAHSPDSLALAREKLARMKTSEISQAAEDNRNG